MFTRYANGRSHDLGELTLGGLTLAFFTFPTVILYLILSVGAGWAAFHYGAHQRLLGCLAAAIATVMAYPMVWYALHRVILHGKLLYRFPLTAPLWKRIHYDHHSDAQRLAVLFSPPLTTLPTMVVITGPIGFVVAGLPGAFSAFLTAVILTTVYEFCHCIYHLNYTPKLAWLRRGKVLHLAHHYRNETGNFGIISFWPDRLFGTLYNQATDRPQSPTVFNLGYDPEVARHYPWVADLVARSAAPVRVSAKPSDDRA